MIDLRHQLAVLAQRMPWAQIGAALAPSFAREVRTGSRTEDVDLFGPRVELVGAGVSNPGRPRLPILLMAARLYLKHAFNLSDEELVIRWSENVVWLAVFQRHGLLHAGAAVRRHADRTLSQGDRRSGGGGIAAGEDRCVCADEGDTRFLP